VTGITGFFEQHILVLSNETGIILSFLELLVREDSSHELDVRGHTDNLVFFKRCVELLNRLLPIFTMYDELCYHRIVEC
jgi:hypothetical protein